MPDLNRGKEFLKKLKRIKQDLPYSPSLLQDLFCMTGENAASSLERIGQTIHRDQGLAAKVLSLANSAFYGIQAKVSSVPRAISLLGIKEVRNLILILGAQALTDKHPLPPTFDLKAYWEHQLATGVCAKMLAERVHMPNPDILFTAGLLHDFGLLLTALHQPEDWAAINAAVAQQRMLFEEAEMQHWSIDHGLIGGLTLQSWNLPPELTLPVIWHHAPHAAPEFGREASLVCLADGIDHRRRAPDDYALSAAAQATLDSSGFKEKEILTELAWVLEDESLAQFVAHLT